MDLEIRLVPDDTVVIDRSLDGSSFRLIGLWTPENDKFDIGCAQLKSARWIRIDGLPGAKGELDAVQAQSCLNDSQ